VEKRAVSSCHDCPFAEKETWFNEYGSGTNYTGCELGLPDNKPAYKSIAELGSFGGPPAWCKLREAPVTIRLKTRP